MSAHVRLETLIARDGGVCLWCGRAPWADDLTAEHLLPRSRSGRGLPENLAVACGMCNRLRRSKPVSAYVRAQLEADRRPRIDLLEAALERLSASSFREHADYGRRQLALLRRIGDRVTP
jgi:5-methylcytosine-specific restriction endonuclease McrA